MTFLLQRCTRTVPIIVLVYVLVAAGPAFLIDLGLPAEGDAVDYRVPLLRWVLQHGQWPNWQWTMVDDYPVLGELLMLPLLAVRTSWARLVPLLAFVGACVAAGLLVPRTWRGGTWVVAALGAAWIAGFRPLTQQMTLLMTDNVASAFLLGCLAALVAARPVLAGMLLAGAAASKYWVWPLGPVVIVVAAMVAPASRRVRFVMTVGALGLIGVVPFMVRNMWLNHNPFFPLFLSVFGQEDLTLRLGHDDYGRGRDLLALLRLPYDLLVTHQLTQLYDYPLGKLINLQGLLMVSAVVWKRRRAQALLRRAWRSSVVRALALFVVLHTVVWFYGAQQLRFLVPALVVINLGMFLVIWRLLPRLMVVGMVLLSVLSVRSVQLDAWRMVWSGQPSPFAAHVDAAQRCLAHVPRDTPVGHQQREGVLGFLDGAFVFVPPHPYAIGPDPKPELIHAPQGIPIPGYEPEPGHPCVLKRKGSEG